MDLEKSVNDLWIKEARFEEWEKQTDSKIKKVEDLVEDINKLTQSISEIVNEIKIMRENVNDLNERVRTIELQPAKQYNNIVEKVIIGGLSAVFGYFINFKA